MHSYALCHDWHGLPTCSSRQNTWPSKATRINDGSLNTVTEVKQSSGRTTRTNAQFA
jgi:hypothetical protein